MWLDDLKENVLKINNEEQKNKKVYGEKIEQSKQLRKSYFVRPKLLTDWEFQKQKKNHGKLTRDIQVKQFSTEIDYDKQWNKLKYEHKMNRIIDYVKKNNIDSSTKKLLIQLNKQRKIKVEYDNGEITKILNLEEN